VTAIVYLRKTRAVGPYDNAPRVTRDVVGSRSCDVDPEAVQAAAIALGVPLTVAAKAANNTASGLWTSLQFTGEGEPELCVRF
jgi:hypothetical protein